MKSIPEIQAALEGIGYKIEGRVASKTVESYSLKMNFHEEPFDVIFFKPDKTRVKVSSWISGNGTIDDELKKVQAAIAEDNDETEPKTAEVVEVTKIEKPDEAVVSKMETPVIKAVVPVAKTNQPAIQDMTDAERDRMIETAKAKRVLEQGGSHYPVQGSQVPDAMMTSSIANERDISIELIEAIQTDEYAHVVVRGHCGKQFVDATVHHDFNVVFQLKTMEIIKKNPDILDHYEGLEPVIKDDAKIRVGDKLEDAKYFMIHTLLSFKTFALRDARTKAAAICQKMLLNRDWQGKEERASEQAEHDLVEESIKNRR